MSRSRGTLSGHVCIIGVMSGCATKYCKVRRVYRRYGRRDQRATWGEAGQKYLNVIIESRSVAMKSRLHLIFIYNIYFYFFEKSFKIGVS